MCVCVCVQSWVPGYTLSGAASVGNGLEMSSRPCTPSARVVSADTTQVQVESTYIIRGFGMQVQHPCG